MNNNRVEEIKKDDKKAFKGFIVLMVISAMVGGVIGFMSSSIDANMSNAISSILKNILMTITPFASLVISILVIIINKVICTSTRKEYYLWKKTCEDDDTIDKIEEKLSYVLLFTAVNLILGFFFFGAGTIFTPFDNMIGELSFIKISCFVVGFLLCVVSSILIQKKIVNFEKEINPLLNGSVYDTKFAKKFIDSCDEAIQLGIYKSAYKAYSAVSTTCIILWLCCVIGSLVWDFGILPMLMVTIIWLVQTITYCMESIRLSKTK